MGDYYVPDLKLPEEHRPIGMWGRLHRTYLEQYRPTRFSALCLSGELHTYLADLDEQATERCSLIIEQMKQAEGVTVAFSRGCDRNHESRQSDVVGTVHELYP